MTEDHKHHLRELGLSSAAIDKAAASGLTFLQILQLVAQYGSVALQILEDIIQKLAPKSLHH